MSDMTRVDWPSDVLRGEHQVILRVLRVLRHLVDRSKRGEGLHTASAIQCAEFLRLFADACHHAKEEDLLFPAMESAGIPREEGPVGCMLHEHTVARDLTKRMGDSARAVDAGDAGAEEAWCTAAHEYADLLSQHIEKEDTILFTMGDNLMANEVQHSLIEKFREVQQRSFDGKSRDELLKMADDLEAQWKGA